MHIFQLKDSFNSLWFEQNQSMLPRTTLGDLFILNIIFHEFSQFFTIFYNFLQFFIMLTMASH